MTPVTDPAILAQLGDPAEAAPAESKHKIVTDPAILAQLGDPAEAVKPVDKDEERRHATSGGGVAKKPSLWERIKGAGEATLATATGALAGAVAPALAVPLHAAGAALDPKWATEQAKRAAPDTGHVAGQDHRMPLDVTASDIQEGMTYQPRTEEGKRQTAAVSEAASPVLNELGKLPIGSGEFNAASSLAKPALGQAAHVTAPEIALAGKAAGKVGEAAGKMAGSIIPKISPEAATLADKALKLGVKIPPHMLSRNEFVRMAGQFVDELPLSGSTKVRNREAFNGFLAKQIGIAEDVKAVTPAVYARAMRKSGGKIGEIFSKIEVPENDPALVKDLSDLLNAQGTELPAVKSVVEGHVQELSKIAAENNGVIPGSTLKKLHSRIADKLRSDLTAHPGLKGQLSDFQEILEDAADRQITDPETKAAYAEARMHYAKGKILEPLVAKNDVSGVTPSDLIGKMTSTAEGRRRMAMGAAGELGDAAAIAQNFLKEEKVSRAAGRGFVLGAITEAAGVGKAALGVGLGNIYNRFGPIISKAIIKRSLPKEVPKVTPAGKPELALAEESPFKPKEVPAPDAPPTRGLLSAEKPEEAAQRIGTVSGRDDKGNLIDFPLRQEVLQKPEFQTVINAYRTESADLEQVVKNAINPTVRKNARVKLDELQKDFAAGMKEFGVKSAQDAHGLRRPLYESGKEPQLPVKKTFEPTKGEAE